MGFRFRKTIRIAPGLRLNISKGGVSTSIGGRGATVNVGRRGVRGTVGIPGTGLSWSERIGGGQRRQPAVADEPVVAEVPLPVVEGSERNRLGLSLVRGLLERFSRRS